MGREFRFQEIFINCRKYFMGMLDRYKKKGGFVQLVQLIETTAKPKQDQFLQIIKNENPAWEEAIRKYVLTVDKIFSWPSHALAEVFSRVQPLTIAVILQDRDQATFDSCLSFLTHADRRKIQDIMDEKKTTPAERLTCCYKLITDVRGYIQQGLIKIEKIDLEMQIPEDIEEKLSQQNEPVLDFSKVETIEPSDAKPTNSEKHSSNNSNKDELDFLKRKVNGLVAENAQLKHDVNLLRGKLDQIKKIA